MLLGLETFSYHLAFAYGRMDVFGFIRRVKDLGLDGAQLNVEGDDLGHLGGDDPDHLRRVRGLLEDLGLYVELDTCGTSPANLLRVMRVCQALGADRMRVYASFGGDLDRELAQAVVDLKQVMPVLGDNGVKLAFENHEYESSARILEVVRAVDHPNLGTHVDTGNSMMIWEDPLEAVANLAPYGVSSHFKDHLVIQVGGQPMIAGVPLGRGSIDQRAALELLATRSPLTRVNIEVCYGYLAPFRVPQERGWGGVLGRGAFRVAQPPYDPEVVAPHLLRAMDAGISLASHAWRELALGAKSQAEREDLMAHQDRAVVESVRHVLALRAEMSERGA